jgi:hypothetical protein
MDKSAPNALRTSGQILPMNDLQHDTCMRRRESKKNKERINTRQGTVTLYPWSYLAPKRVRNALILLKYKSARLLFTDTGRRLL